MSDPFTPRPTLDPAFLNKPAKDHRAPDPNAVKKRLVVCCDGTWQSSVSGVRNIPSNVTRLARAIARSGVDKHGEVWQQVVYYDAGIGTGSLNADERSRQGGLGAGFVENVIEAYNWLVLNYTAGDQIFCFGFSRGAYTARAVAGLVTDIGIITPRDMQDFPELYALYQKHTDSHHFRKSNDYREWVNGKVGDKAPVELGGFNPGYQYVEGKTPRESPPEASRMIELVGVFDTVGALGIPDLPWTLWEEKKIPLIEGFLNVPRFGFHNPDLSPFIRHAFHALALDESRSPFGPTLWYYPPQDDMEPKKPAVSLDDAKTNWDKIHKTPGSSPEDLGKAWSDLVDAQMYKELHGLDKPELLQVYFPGVHINCGGGSDDILKEWKGDLEQIAIITFAWMCEQVAPYLQLDGDLEQVATAAVADRLRLLQPIYDGISKNEKDFGSGWTSGLWRRLEGIGLHLSPNKLIDELASNEWALGPILDNHTGVMALSGTTVRTPGQYKTQVVADKKRELGKTFEYIHPSVTFRIENHPDYKPAALKGFKRHEHVKAGQAYEWRLHGSDVTVPEYLVRPDDAFSRKLAREARTSAGKFIGEIDKKAGQAETLEARAYD